MSISEEIYEGLDESPAAFPLLVKCRQALVFAIGVYMLVNTCEEYFAPSLATIANKLKCSPTLAISA